MGLGSLKFAFKNFFIQNFLQYKIRKRNLLGYNCKLSKDIIIGSHCNIRNYVIIGSNVILGNNITIGSDSKINNITVGNNSQIDCGVICTGDGNGRITIGEETYIGINNVLDWSESISIGNHVHIAGPSTGLWTHSSAMQAIAGLPLNDKNLNFRPTRPIFIDDNVYIGGNCTIYPGINIGHHSIIAPNSVVNVDVEPYTMVGGVPIHFIKKV